MEMKRFLLFSLEALVTWTFDNLVGIMVVAGVIAYAVSVGRDRLNLRPIQTRRTLRRVPLSMRPRKL